MTAPFPAVAWSSRISAERRSISRTSFAMNPPMSTDAARLIEPSIRPPATAGVNVQDNQFVATTVRVQAGGTVRWTWQGNNPHNVTFAGGPASSTQTEGSFERAFATAGTFSYLCTVHGQSMSGTVTVVAPTEAASRVARYRWIDIWSDPAVQVVRLVVEAEHGGIEVEERVEVDEAGVAVAHHAAPGLAQRRRVGVGAAVVAAPAVQRVVDQVAGMHRAAAAIVHGEHSLGDGKARQLPYRRRAAERRRLREAIRRTH